MSRLSMKDVNYRVAVSLVLVSIALRVGSRTPLKIRG